MRWHTAHILELNGDVLHPERVEPGFDVLPHLHRSLLAPHVQTGVHAGNRNVRAYPPNVKVMDISHTPDPAQLPLQIGDVLYWRPVEDYRSPFPRDRDRTPQHHQSNENRDDRIKNVETGERDRNGSSDDG